MKPPEMTTLCYIERDGRWLMLHRTRKQHDGNAGKWLGIGGHFEAGESPEECMLREVREETGLTLTEYAFRGIVTFVSGDWVEYMHLFTASRYEGTLSEDCPEGELQWVGRDRLFERPMWEGDRVFLRLIEKPGPFFSLKLTYEGDRLAEAALNGRPLALH